MTKIALGLTALAFAALAPLAAEASVQKSTRVAPTIGSNDCKVSSEFTYCNGNQIGEVSKSYQLFNGSNNPATTSDTPILKVLVPSAKPYNGGDV